MTETRHGWFLVLDGPEGAGKTTQAEHLVQHLRDTGREATTVRDPGSTPVSERIREVLLDRRLPEMDARTEVFLYMASRAEMVARIIRPALDVGLIVVCDRFVSATVAYQGYAGGIDPDLIWHLGRTACGGLEPDLTVILDLPVQEGLARARALAEPDRIEAKGPVYHEKVRQGFLAMAEARPEVFAVVDASRPPDAVADAIWEAAKRVF